MTSITVTVARRTLITACGGTSSGHSSEWREFLAANGGSGGVSERDVEMRFLASKGFTQTTYADRLTAYLNGKGYTTGLLTDKYLQWLNGGAL